ncbi:hypothetical protein CONCODRAFT_1919 [Conidiobolus coronatus NRRL 28638]|uniref:Galactose oxidase n=1 Tax=Conidiobolus coronatus (strain ATCC 28846 / CBS 209.66 / NRRL 28638) TaxID=796925 RepID=A0A137PIM3_CONC2|nr:hypothetical protein CONCODRAFT_1919 [Conidiobolus coronatus NRRL 28638]|eukprot:KXN74854.1 hypothetical protein CONCODRAFT_1919 [Conidiobolus coronatus NRRL 28638]
MLIILFIIYILSAVSQLERLISTTIRDDRIIAIYRNLELDNFKIRVLELEYTSTKRIFNKAKTFDLNGTYEKVDLDIVVIPDILYEDKNMLWLKFEYHGLVFNPATSPSMNWIGYLNLDDMTLKNGSSLIQFPTYENFPVKGYTINTIKNGLGAALYVTGGELYSKKDNIYSASNSFFKYDFTSKEWIDMTYSITGKLKPLFNHKSVVIDNRYLVILGGRRRIIYNSKPDVFDSDYPEFEYNSLYNLTIFDTFNNSWENVNINIDIFDTNSTSIQFSNILATAYKDKIIVYAGGASNNRSNIREIDTYLGILDFKSKNWTCSSIIDVSDYVKGVNDIPIAVYEMNSQRMWLYLILPNSWNYNSDYEKDETQNLPTYAIFLIAVSWAVLPGALMILLYYISKSSSNSENDKTEYNGPIREVWANPDINNTNNINLCDKRKGLNIKKNNPNAPKSNRLGSNIGTSNISNTIEFSK